MDNMQIAFIICSNNEMYYGECVKYIQELEVPAGYEVDILCIQEAQSMVQGYNGGMQASNAKYKVYLHHDTFILNRRFIYDILDIFQNDMSVGMIGMIGALNLPEDANCYLAWNVGRIKAYNGVNLFKGDLYQKEGAPYIEVAAIDGLLMATQYDIPWREDFLDGWDFYDVSQSLEMRKQGYKVVVPFQGETWCYHDCGPSKLKQYDFYRKLMIEKYSEFFCGKVDEIKLNERRVLLDETDKIKDVFVRLMEEKMYSELLGFVPQVREMWLEDIHIREIINLMEIYEMEEQDLSGNHSRLFCCESWKQLYEYYKWIRLILISHEYEHTDDRIEELQRDIKEGIISRIAVRKIASASVGSTGKIETLLINVK